MDKPIRNEYPLTGIAMKASANLQVALIQLPSSAYLLTDLSRMRSCCQRWLQGRLAQSSAVGGKGREEGAKGGAVARRHLLRV